MASLCLADRLQIYIIWFVYAGDSEYVIQKTKKLPDETKTEFERFKLALFMISTVRAFQYLYPQF